MSKVRQLEARIKIALLEGKKLTSAKVWAKYHSSRLASYIHRLRCKGLKIETTMVTDPDTGDTYAEYTIPKRKKENRIKTLNYK
jgi:hypothetical protein